MLYPPPIKQQYTSTAHIHHYNLNNCFAPQPKHHQEIDSTQEKFCMYQAAKERRPFLRRTKATAPPDVDGETTTTSTIETSTNKFTRRGSNKFKIQKTEKEEKPRETETEKPSLNGVASRSDRPRNFVRRRLGGANSSTTIKPSSSTQALQPRRPFRVASRRRPVTFGSTTTTTTTARTTTALVESEESLQDIGDIDAIEDPSLRPSTTERTANVQRRRPLVQLKSDDQSPSATIEEEKKRQSKKYSASFRQNQLDEILKLRSSAEEIDVTTEGKTTLEDISAETAVALAAHQLLEAPIPIIPDYDDELGSTTKRPTQTIIDYKFTSPEYTEDFTKTHTYPEEYTRTPTYTSTRHKFTDTSTGSYSSLQTDFDAPSSTPSPFNTDTRLPGFTTGAYTNRFSRPTIDAASTINPTISGITLNLGSEGSGESTARYASFPTETNPTAYTTSNYESRVSRPGYSTSIVDPTTPRVSLNFRESTAKYTSSDREVPPTYPTGFTRKVSRPGGFSPNLVNVDEISEKSTVRYKGSSKRGPSTARYEGSSDKIPGPLVFGYSTGGQGLQEPSYFTREYLLESPVTKSYDDEYQYLSSKVTSPQPSSRKPARRRTVFRRISTTQSPTSALPQTTLKPRRTTRKPFEKIPVKKISVQKDDVQKELVQTPVQSVKIPVDTVQKKVVQKVPKAPVQRVPEPSGAVRPISDYDYYDDGQEKVVENFEEANKVILHGKGNIECLDIGNFPHPTSCKKFISCARMESGAVIGWEYICPKGLSFDPVGSICNWSAGLGCNEKDV